MLTDDTIKDLINSPLETQTLLKTSLKLFIKVFHYYLTKQNFIFKPFHNEIIESIENIVYAKATKKNLAISISPRCGKSITVKYALAWFYAVNKDCNNIYTSYSDKLIQKFSGEIRDIIESDLYIKLFNITLKKDTTAKSLWQIDNGGQLMASPMGGSITGFGAGTSSNDFGGALVIDDPMKADDFKSETERQNVIDFYTGTLKTRLNNTEKTPIILIMQRLHQDDLIGYIQKNEPEDWNFIKVSAIDKDNNSIFPEKLSIDFLRQIERTTPFIFHSQYQQEPIAIGGNLIKSEWFKRYTVPPERFKQLYITCDTAFSDKKTADNSVFMLSGITDDNRLYILDVYCKKVLFPDLVKDLKAFYQKAIANYGRFNNINAVYIENKGSGQSLIQQLRDEGLPIVELYPTHYNAQLKKEQTTDKYTRFLEISADLESGYCYIPEVSSWSLNFLAECEAFTGTNKDVHDDQVDCLIYALKTRRNNLLIDWKTIKKVFS
jgi:predicted phage terminase large subunit-like protein